MEETDKAAKLIARLVRLTKAKKLDWETVRSPRNEAESAYAADLNGRRVRLFRYQEEVPAPGVGEYITGITGILAPHAGYGQRGPIRRDIVALQLLDRYSDRPAYTFEQVSGLRDLFESASFSAAHAEEFIDSVLSQELERQK